MTSETIYAILHEMWLNLLVILDKLPSRYIRFSQVTDATDHFWFPLFGGLSTYDLERITREYFKDEP